METKRKFFIETITALCFWTTNGADVLSAKEDIMPFGSLLKTLDISK